MRQYVHFVRFCCSASKLNISFVFDNFEIVCDDMTVETLARETEVRYFRLSVFCRGNEPNEETKTCFEGKNNRCGVN